MAEPFAAAGLEIARGAESALLSTIAQAHEELHRSAARAVRVTLDSTLDRDLGFDSLARVELLLRIERAFGVVLPENTLALAETPRDLLAALKASVRSTSPVQRPAVRLDRAAVSETIPVEARTLIEVLDWHVARRAEKVQIVYCTEQGEQDISYAQLRREAGKVAAGLLRRGLRRGQTVAIMLPTAPEYFYTYFGALLAGGVPVPIYPPARLSQIEEHVQRHAGILTNALASVLVTVPEAKPVARLLEAHVAGLRQVATVSELAEETREAPAAWAQENDIAFIQYTSGSTGNPKGVVLTHANLLANIRAIGEAVRIKSDDVFVSWLPLYHDMGLIAAWLASLYHGCRLAVMSPLAFLARPERWLWALDRHRGTLTAAPNFAYELCVRRIADSQIDRLDLSTVRFMANGAEPVSPDTMARFQERFARFGFRPEAMTPVYGLAESTVGLICPPPGRGPIVDRIRREPFEREGKALPAGPEEMNVLRFVGCGQPLPEHRIRIVDAAGEEVGDRIEGRLQFKGPSATSGYYRNPQETARLMCGGWLDTGDRAYTANSDVYLTGRVKDIIIRGGRNIYPQEIEEAVGALPGVRKGCVAVFGSPDPASGTERLVVLAETRETERDAREILRQTISQSVVDVLGEPADEVVLAPPHTVLKTSSGKLRRAASRELYEAGLVGARSRAAWLQVVRLISSAVWRQFRDGSELTARLLYGSYASLVFILIAAATWLVTAITPRPEWAWALTHRAARLFLRLCAMPYTVEGLENLPGDSACVVVANHASYLDGFVLVAALPRHYSFVAKSELRGHIVSRVYLQRLGVELVERFAAQQSVADTERLGRIAADKRSLIFFPEGTFGRVPGLLPFHLGAFVIAAANRLPIVPIAIRGARTALRDGRWLLRRGPLVVTVGKPIYPADGADTFATALELRDLARAEILRHCGEPDAAAGGQGFPRPGEA